MDLRKFWKSPAECSSIYGGFKANENNMHNMVKYHLEDSFKFLLMVRHRPLHSYMDRNERLGVYHRGPTFLGQFVTKPVVTQVTPRYQMKDIDIIIPLIHLSLL